MTAVSTLLDEQFPSAAADQKFDHVREPYRGAEIRLSQPTPPFENHRGVRGDRPVVVGRDAADTSNQTGLS